MIIEKIPISKIRATAYNPRKDLQPGDPEYEMLKRSIEEFGYIDPLIWNKRTGNLVGGHQRLKVLIERGDTECEVSVVDLDDAREKALNIALNKISGDWDREKLYTLLEELVPQIDLELTGFNHQELAILELEFEPQPAVEDGFDVEEEYRKIRKPITQLGDVWQLGSHCLMCGDSTKARDVKRLMGKDVKAHMVFTDPPYGINYESHKTGRSKKKWDKILNDDTKDVKGFCISFLEIIREFTVGDSSYYICFGTKTLHHLKTAMDELGIHYTPVDIHWDKGRPTISWDRYHPDYEPIVYAGEGSKPTGKMSRWYGPKNERTTWRISTPGKYNHPTQKPVALSARAIRNSSRKGEIILDIFVGGGSTLIAGEITERICYVMELDPAYCDVTVKRWEAFTGQKAVKIIHGPIPKVMSKMSGSRGVPAK